MSRALQIQRVMEKNEYNLMIQKTDERDGAESTNRAHNTITLRNEEYEEVFRWLKKTETGVVHRDTYPCPPGGREFGGTAVAIRSTTHHGVMVSTTPPNNCVVANMVGKGIRYGMVTHIYRLRDHNFAERTLLFIRPIKNIYPKLLGVPTTRFRFFLWLLKVVIGQVSDAQRGFLIEPQHVDSVAAYRLFRRPAFGIQSRGIILTPYTRSPLLDLTDEPDT